MTKILADSQGKKLSFKEADWRLNGCSDVVVRRTRGGGQGRPDIRMELTRKEIKTDDSSSSEDEAEGGDPEAELEEGMMMDDDTTTKKSAKQSYTR